LASVGFWAISAYIWMMRREMAAEIQQIALV
jgi:hypothetical protein